MRVAGQCSSLKLKNRVPGCLTRLEQLPVLARRVDEDSPTDYVTIGEEDIRRVLNPADEDIGAVHFAVRANAEAHPTESFAVYLGDYVRAGEVPVEAQDTVVD